MIFTTNMNKLPLLVIIYVINILRSFSITYYFIISKLVDTFIFINKYIRELFFYNFYREPMVILRDFAMGLIAAIVAKRKITISKRGIEVTYELIARLDKVSSSLFL